MRVSAPSAGGKSEEISFDACDQYTLQADALGRAIQNDTPVLNPLADAVANMRAIERVTAKIDWAEKI